MSILAFSTWLQSELDNRGWRPTDLAKRSSISDTTVSRILRGERNADIETLKAFAHAFKLPPEQVYRAAGILQPKPDMNEIIEQILHDIQDLPEADQQEVLAYIRMKNNLRNQRKKK